MAGGWGLMSLFRLWLNQMRAVRGKGIRAVREIQERVKLNLHMPINIDHVLSQSIGSISYGFSNDIPIPEKH